MRELLADVAGQDPRVRKGKELLREALAAHQQLVTGIRPPDPDREGELANGLEAVAELRGQAPLLPYLGSGFGRGPYVELIDGSIKLDFIGGIGVHYLGHGHPRIVAAAVDAAFSDLVMQGHLQQNRDAVDLGQRLLALANRNGANLAHSVLTTSGAMANENALKIAFQKHAPASRVLAFEGGFCGRTLALSQITDRPGYREGLPATLAVDYLPFFDPGDPAGSTARALQTLRKHLACHPGRHAAMLLELVLGEGGFYPGDREFFRVLIEELRRAEIAVVVDEIQTFGRTAEPFAFQLYGLDDAVDVVTLGKMTQVCATLYRDEYQPRPGLVSQTFTGATASIRAARVVLDVLTEGDYFGSDGRIETLGAGFRRRLGELAERFPDRVRGPFGIGAMVAFTPLDGSQEVAKRVVQELFQQGVIAFTAGAAPTRVRFLVPAGVATLEDVDTACEVLARVLESVDQ